MDGLNPDNNFIKNPCNTKSGTHMPQKGLKNANLGIFDLFGTTPSFKIQGHKKHYSFCGLFLTLMVTGFVIWSLVLTSSDLVERTNPRLVASELPGAVFNDTFILLPEDFNVKIGLYNIMQGALYIDPTIYTVKATLTNLAGQTPSEIFISLDLEVCQSDMVTTNNKYWCIKANQSKVQDLFLNRQAFIQLDFLRCNNRTSGGTCATLSAINSQLKYSYAQIEYLKWAVAPTDYQQPLKSYYVNEQQGILQSLHKIVNIYMNKMNFISDNGWLTSKPVEQTVIYPDNSVVDIQEAISSAFFSYAFYPSGNEVVYTRQYTKIQDILAQVSGLAGTFILIIGLLGRPFEEFKMYEKVINTMYDIKVKKYKRNSRPVPPANATKAKGNFNVGLQTMSEECIAQRQLSYLPTFNGDDLLTKRTNDGLLTDRLSLNKRISIDIPSDSNRAKRILDVPTSERRKVGEKPARSSFSCSPNNRFTDRDSDISKIEREEEQEKSHEIHELELVQIGKQVSETASEANPSFVQTRFENSIRMNSRKDNQFHKPIDVKLPEDSVHEEGSADNKDEKEDVEIEVVMEGLEDSSPAHGIVFPQNTIVQSPSNIETGGNLLRQVPTNNENCQSRKPPAPEEPSQKLNISYFEWLISFIKPTQKMKIFHRGKEEVMKQMDIITVVNKLAELDKMKAFLLTKEQQVLFDNLKKPKIFVDWNETKRKTEAVKLNAWSEAQETEKVKPIEAYQTLKKMGSQSVLDRKLTFLFEKDEELVEQKSAI